MIKESQYYYDRQLRNYILQFMAIFAGLQVRVGKLLDTEPRLINVPIQYGDQSLVVASIFAENTHTKPIRLPIMSAYMRDIDISESRMVGSGVERRNTYVPTGGLIPNDVKVIHQRKPVPYNMTMELNIYVSNTDQHFQVLEQIFMLFNPQLTIQVSDGVFDWKRLTSVFLKQSRIDTNFPAGQDRRMIQSTITFDVPIFIDSPAEIRRDFVEKIYARVGAISTATVDNYDIIAELDAQGINYDLLFDSSELPIT